jgi:hypothetical protein
MLYHRETGFIDVVIEPQFKDFTFGSQLCSVDLGILKTSGAKSNVL